MIKKVRHIILIIILQITTTSVFSQSIENGMWKGIIHYKTVEVPFTFSFNSTSDTTALVTIINAEEKIEIKNSIIKNDSIYIPMYVFDAVIKASYKNGKMVGEWHKNYRDSKGPLFTAEFNKPRFKETLTKSYIQIQPTWDITFKQPNGVTTKAIGLFKQNENKLTGTIMTELGDFRYFDGIIYDDSIRISSFDGVHGFLMLGKLSNGNWNGVFHYENDYSESWIATYNQEASLSEPFSIITVEPETHKPYYDILTAGGVYNSIDLDLLEGKVVIIQLMGTWCPNSLDQSKYLANWYKKQNKNQIALMAITYEPGEKGYAQNRIDSYSKLLDITYPMYIGGTLSKGQAALAFPNMGVINAFPTLVIIDKKGYIRHINSYFNGPATDNYYQEFDKEFNLKIENLLTE